MGFLDRLHEFDVHEMANTIFNEIWKWYHFNDREFLFSVLEVCVHRWDLLSLTPWENIYDFSCEKFLQTKLNRMDVSRLKLINRFAERTNASSSMLSSFFLSFLFLPILCLTTSLVNAIWKNERWRYGCVAVVWRFCHAPGWAMSSERPPHIRFRVAHRKSLTTTTLVWLTFGWMNGANFTTVSIQVLINYIIY